MSRLFIISFIPFLFYACAGKKQEIQPLKLDDQLSCYNKENIESYHPESIIGLYYLTNEKDTLHPTELYFSDSLRFTTSFKNIKVPDICIYANMQGTTYYSVQINDTGGFQDFKTVRRVSKSFDEYDEKVKKKLDQSKLIDSTYYNRELIFFHKFILH